MANEIDEQERQYGPDDSEAFSMPSPNNKEQLACVTKDATGEHHHLTEFSISEHSIQVTIFICKCIL